jgi:hypothetical protein
MNRPLPQSQAGVPHTTLAAQTCFRDRTCGSVRPPKSEQAFVGGNHVVQLRNGSSAINGDLLSSAAQANRCRSPPLSRDAGSVVKQVARLTGKTIDGRYRPIHFSVPVEPPRTQWPSLSGRPSDTDYCVRPNGTSIESDDELSSWRKSVNRPFAEKARTKTTAFPRMERGSAGAPVLHTCLQFSPGR